MFRVLLCITCCNAQAKSRPTPAKEQPVENDVKSDCKTLSLASIDEKKPLLTDKHMIRYESGNNEPPDQSPSNLVSRKDQDQSICLRDGKENSEYLELGSQNKHHGYNSAEATGGSESIISSIGTENFAEFNNSYESTNGSQGKAIGYLENNETNLSPKSDKSFSRIGDYARIEYSSIPDGGSSIASRIGLAGDSEWEMSIASNDIERQTTQSERVERIKNEMSINTSPDISKSTSIISNLSNERLQQSLTNVLESGQSTSLMYGTIGLPLGRVQNIGEFSNLMSGNTKNSSETIGAALTCASRSSQGSLGSFTNKGDDSDNGPTSPGAALTGESNHEDSAEITPKMDNKFSLGRTDSTSPSLISKTPTPSELSGSSSLKQKGKLKAKALLKKLKPGKKDKSSKKPKNQD